MTRAIDKHRRAAWAAVAYVAVLCGMGAACGSSKRYDDVYVHATGGTGATSGATSTGGAAGDDSGNLAVGGAGGAGGSAAAGDAGAGPDGVDGDVLYIKSSNPDDNDRFGCALALSADWLAIAAVHESSVAVGIDGDQTDDSEDNSGAVYLFLHEPSGWVQRAYVKASNSEAGDSFGSVLSFSGHTLAVGAPHEDGAANGVNGDEGNGKGGNQGAAYVFVEQDGTWTQQAYVKAPNTDAIDLFGTDVALSGDVLVVGAPWEDSAATTVDGDQTSNAASASGAAYVYERSGEQWQPISYLKASNGEADDELGQAVAVSGDTIAVGAPGESSGDATEPNDNSASRSGAVYVFQRLGASYEQVAYLKASNADAGDAFGSRLALASDTLVVGATREGTLGGDGKSSNELRPDSGAAYVFERRSGDWVQTAYLKAPIPVERAYFGNVLALEGDTLVVGALGDDSEELPLSGTVYLYTRTPEGWQLSTTMKAPNAEIGDRYGSSVAISQALLAVGASNEASNAAGIAGDWTNNDTPGAGAAYLYRR